jgi:hypothetical protein
MKNLIPFLVLVVSASSACNRGGAADTASAEATAPPAAAVTSVAGMPLDSALVLLSNELDAAIANRLDNTGFERFQRAEALTDRLLETRYPFAWLKSESYSLESKLRQIQALADRILAEQRSGLDADSVLVDVRLAREEVAELRDALRRGGERAPPPLEKLLAGRDTLTPRAPIGAPQEVEGR